MDVADRSSSNDLSSAPNSDIEGFSSSHNLSNTIVIAQQPINGSVSRNSGTVGAVGVAGANDRQDPAPKQRKPRKKKDSDAAPASAEKREKGVRKSRGASNAATGTIRKRLKTDPGTPTLISQNVPVMSDTVYSRPTQQAAAEYSVQANSTNIEAAKVSQNGFSNNNPSVTATQKTILPQYRPTPPPLPPPPQPQVIRSMAYDPVRSLTGPRNTDSLPNTTVAPHASLSTPPRTVYNPSTSPAISSIINPPEAFSGETQVPPSLYQSQSENRIPTVATTIKSNDDIAMADMDPPSSKTESIKKETFDTAPVKPVTKSRAKEQPPPLPTGSGLLSSSLFGGDSGMDSDKTSSDKGTSIVLHIDLKDPNNQVINFARMAEEKYGFAALYPRQAAQKERLAKVAAAGAALERASSGIKGTPAGESGDEDVSVDIDRDSENDGDIAMSGMNGTGEAVNSGTDGPMPKRRKRKDEYDADDPFVDDSELLWEAQAAASKDGFFVYCGPLVPEGEKPTVERADGTIKRGRGRGRGGGPGSRGGRGAAAAAARDAESGSGTGRGGGPGSRGGNITRKPRITKAERAQRELEKKQREQMAVLAAKPPNYQP